MADFLLIHGSCHGAWCWRDVIPKLAARGHAARAIDLPGHGQDPTPVNDVTLDGYARAILAALHGPTIVVGHSMGGFPITRAADLDPTRIAHLIYLCAYVPLGGTSLADQRRRAPRQPLLPAIRRAADGRSFTIDPAMARDVFYHDCDADTAAWATRHLGPQAVAPQETPFTPGPHVATIPRDYILCDDDRTIPPEYQATMTAHWPPGSVHHLPCGHSPFLACPARLAETLARIAEPHA
jgi:pimeloyl-ACP methyl ester carboxylesterase